MINEPIIVFDGVCNLCNGAIQFILKRDRDKLFHFAWLQSDFGKQQASVLNLKTDYPETIILLHNQKVFQKSDAVVEIMRQLPGIWPYLAIIKIIPKTIRDRVYEFIAANRYRWFGRQQSCQLTGLEIQKRFITSNEGVW